MEIVLGTPEAQLALGERLADVLIPPAIIYLKGDLGTGKTTLTRGILRGLGHRGSVRSPTYTLIEPYDLPRGPLYHLDLYRLGHPDELEYLGLRDVLTRDALCVVEWPERGVGLLPKADLMVEILYRPEGRHLRFTAATSCGEGILSRFGDGARESK